MRKTIFFGLLMAAGYFGFSQEKTLVHSLLLKPKAGMKLQFENSMKAHNQKFHPAANKVYVFEIISGEKTGFFQIAWPPTSWDEMDNRKTTPAHDQNVQTTIDSKVEVNEGMVFSRRVDSLSHGNNDWTIQKSRITMYKIRPGKMDEILVWVRKIKMVYDNTNDQRNYTTYIKQLTGLSGELLFVFRYKNGWKEMEPDYYPALKEIFTKAYSAAEWEAFLKSYDDCVESMETYLRVYRTDLSSK